MSAPEVKEHEEELTEARLETVREKLAGVHKITDELDIVDEKAVAGDAEFFMAPTNSNAAMHGSKPSLSASSSSSSSTCSFTTAPESNGIEGSVEPVLTSSKINMLKDLIERSKYIPMRLNSSERLLLNVVEGALEVSEYTDKVDVSSNNYFARTAYDKYDTVECQTDKLCKTLAGLAICNDYRSLGKDLLGKDLVGNEEFFSTVLEIGRRYKIMNPDKMRTNYGKLLYVIMDNRAPATRAKVNLHKRVKTVWHVLEKVDATEMLSDQLLVVAASEIEGGTQEQVEAAKEQKVEALEMIVKKYASEKLGEETVRLVIASISDNFSFLRSFREPVDKMIGYLKTYFDPKNEPKDPVLSLRLRRGVGGSKETRSHETQFFYVYQSLLLWREIMGNFFRLWFLAEDDLLDNRNGYRLANTGQGLQRCQGAPRVSRAMHEIVSNVKSKVGHWIGLSVVHLGDRDVPNAFIFIDKYTQVPRILAPIANTVSYLEKTCTKDADIQEWVDENFGSVEHLRTLILADYFRHGYDSQGDDGGSCIDGRLTSSWHWTSKLEKKKYYPVFMLSASFQGFDGDFS